MRSWTPFALLALSMASWTTGCSANVGEREDAITTATEGSYLGRAVVDALQAKYPDESNRLWSVSARNTLGADWLQEVPVAATWGQRVLKAPPPCDRGTVCDPDFGLRVCQTDSQCGDGGHCVALAATVAHEGDARRSLCIGHSDTSLDAIYNTLVSAKSYLDLTSLTPPDGRYEAAVRNALTRLSEREHPPTVRMLFGSFPGSFFTTQGTRRSLTRDIKADSQIRVVVGAYNAWFTSWNHSKIIAVDGNMVLSGGTNMWTEHYLQANPVHDISLLAHGAAAIDAHRYVNTLWDYTCAYGDISARITYDQCEPPFRPSEAMPTDTSGDVSMIALGRLGKIGANPSTDALIALMDASKTSLKIIQQDLGPVKRMGLSLGGWPNDVLGAILRAVHRGVDVRLVLSNPEALGGTPGFFGATAATYANGWSGDDLIETLADYAKDHPEIGDSKAVVAAMCKHLHLYNLRSSEASTWDNGGTLALHSKIVIADDKAFYLGSENLYQAALAEFGYIVDNERMTHAILREYFDKVDGFSRGTVLTPERCSW